MNKDVTDKVRFGSVDDESLPIDKCVCGEKFNGWADYVISIYDDNPHVCDKCGAKLFFRNSIRIYQVVDDEKA